MQFLYFLKVHFRLFFFSERSRPLKNGINGQVQVSSCVNNLKHMALDMNNEITTQNAQMDRLNSKVQSNKDRISDANKRAITLLK